MDGTLVEWRTNYAYGADESQWKNTTDDLLNPGTPKYDNADEPYGFTGKEEDKDVGLHYFGARYYSAYLGRWLSPDSPVVHGIGVANLYFYGGNSPYIYVDPDGNIINLIAGAIGAVVGAIGGAVAGFIKGGWKGALAGAAIGAAVGAAIGVTAGAAAGAFAAAAGISTSSYAAGVFAAGVSATLAFSASAIQTGVQTKNFGQAMLSGFISSSISFVGGVAGGGINTGFANNGITGVGAQFGGAGIGTAIGSTLSGTSIVIQAAIDTKGDLSNADWDTLAAEWGIGVAIGSAISAIGAGLQCLAEPRIGDSGFSEVFEAAEVGESGYESFTYSATPEDHNGETVYFLLGYNEDPKEVADMQNDAHYIQNDAVKAYNKGYKVVVNYAATREDMTKAFHDQNAAGIMISSHGKGQKAATGGINTADEKVFLPSHVSKDDVSKKLKFVILSACGSASVNKGQNWKDVLPEGITFEGYEIDPTLHQTYDFMMTSRNLRFDLRSNHGMMNPNMELEHYIDALP